MAYSNWGAEVWCDGVAMHQNCDVTVNQVLGKSERYAHYLQGLIHGRKEFDSIHHAVVGDIQSGVLVLLYKSYSPTIYRINENGLESVDSGLGDRSWYDLEDELEVMVGNIKIVAYPCSDPEAVSCFFTDAENRHWRATSGYCMGEGHQEWGA